MFESKVFDSWVDCAYDFISWLDYERRQCIPKGICGQSVEITSGWAGLKRKYPTFEDAHKAYMEYLSKL